jgi:hypothetical protein
MINSSLKSAGAMYFDDFYVIDITDRVDLDATSNAVSSLTSRVPVRKVLFPVTPEASRI